MTDVNDKYRRYRELHPDRVKASKQKYREKNLEAVRERDAEHKRRLREEKRKADPPPGNICISCGEPFIYESRGRSPRCPPCRVAWTKALRQGRQHIYDMKPERRYRKRERSEYYRETRERFGVSARERRLRVLDLLGGARCCLCGFLDVRALDIDHVHGGGNQDRINRGITGNHLITRILRGEEDPKDFRVLCRNCNWIAYLELKVSAECVD